MTFKVPVSIVKTYKLQTLCQSRGSLCIVKGIETLNCQFLGIIPYLSLFYRKVRFYEMSLLTKLLDPSAYRTYRNVTENNCCVSFYTIIPSLLVSII